jgi:hypothetical protein
LLKAAANYSRSNARMPTVKVDDGKVDIYYELHGEGPEKVLFITGKQISSDYVLVQMPLARIL